MDNTPDWIKELEQERATVDLSGAALALENLDYAAGVMVAQAVILQQRIDEFRRYLVAQGTINEVQNAASDNQSS